MKLFCIILLVVLIIGVSSAPKNDKDKDKGKDKDKDKEKKCKNCEKKLGKIWPLCGQFDGVPDTFKNLEHFKCLAKCRKVKFEELIHTGPCMKDKAEYKEYLFLAQYHPSYNQTYPNYQ